MCHWLPLLPSIPPPRFAVQIIFHKENPGIDYEFYVPAEKKEEERERPKDRERETPRNTPRETGREREQARAPLRSKYTPVDCPPSCLSAVSKNVPGADVTRPCSQGHRQMKGEKVPESRQRDTPVLMVGEFFPQLKM